MPDLVKYAPPDGCERFSDRDEAKAYQGRCYWRTEIVGFDVVIEYEDGKELRRLEVEHEDG